MPIHPQFLVRDAKGRPVPPPEIVERIRRIDPRLGLFYTNAAWAIYEQWKPDDPRRRWIQEEQMQPEYAFDICGYLPVTCTVDEAPAYIERELRAYSPQQFKALRDAVNQWNDALLDGPVREQVMAGVSDALDKSNDVSPGISEAVPIDLGPAPNAELGDAQGKRVIPNPTAQGAEIFGAKPDAKPEGLMDRLARVAQVKRQKAAGAA